MRKFVALAIMVSLTGFVSLFAPQPTRSADDKSKYLDRIENSGVVLKEILDVPDDIPQNLLDKAECVIIYPSVLKAAFGIGASYGRGVMTCRGGEEFKGPWGAPSMMALEGGSIGFQIGAQATDFVLLVMNDRGASSILSSKVKLGADASAAAGPKGRDAEADTDVTMRAEVLSYSRARGLFAGISLEGSTVRPDNDGNEVVYGARMPASDVVLKGTVPAPKEADQLLSLLNKRSSPHNVSDRK
jgi:SH3 domain-containing YSC84-like protein 1